jgi:hypothetical protein
MDWKARIRRFLEIREPILPSARTEAYDGVILMNDMRNTVNTLFQKYVTPRVDDIVAQQIRQLIEARLREMLVAAHDEWTTELTAALLRHVNTEAEKVSK